MSGGNTQKPLIIVESPTKAKSIQSIFGESAIVLATKGHILTLSPKNQAFITYQGSQPLYHKIRSKHKIIDQLIEEAKNANRIYIATDPDREGETIAYHLKSILEKYSKFIYRIDLNEVTAKNLKVQLNYTRHVNLGSVYARQARKIFDHIIGFKISPQLNNILPNTQSAGRVQSVALNLICSQQTLIQEKPKGQVFRIDARLKSADSKLLEFSFEISAKNKTEAQQQVSNLIGKPLKITDIKYEKNNLAELKPFTTSTLLQEAGSRLGKSCRQIMKVAQQLYEGIEDPDGNWLGLITYPRTENDQINQRIQFLIIEHLRNNYPQYDYENKTTKEDEQHTKEAIRPVSFNYKYSPRQLKPFLTKIQFQLYELIWNRTLASFMNRPSLEKLIITFYNDSFPLRAISTRVLSEGYLKLSNFMPEITRIYPEVKNKELQKGQTLHLAHLKILDICQKNTLRFYESDLINQLDKYGIGRPSTYADILPTLISRKYVKMEKKKIYPTELGLRVNQILNKNFTDIFSTSFTAKMETKLEEIAKNPSLYHEVLDEFRKPIDRSISQFIHENKNNEHSNANLCQLCGSPMIKRRNRQGVIWVCKSVPSCNNREQLDKAEMSF